MVLKHIVWHIFPLNLFWINPSRITEQIDHHQKKQKKVFILIEENTEKENFLDVHSDETKLVLSSFLISCVLMFFRLLFLAIYFLGFMTLGCLFVSSYPIWSEMVIFFNPRFADLRDRVWATNLKNINQVVPYTFQIE